MKFIININPKDIIYASLITGCSISRAKTLNRYGLKLKDKILEGDWNKLKTPFSSLGCYKDYKNFLKGELTGYKHWDFLYNQLKQQRYIQQNDTRYIEVAINIDGEIHFVDGRHRLLLAKEFNIPLIPVEVVFYHPLGLFKNLSIIQDKIIPEYLYNKIREKWETSDKIIYHNYSTIQSRYNLVKEYLPLLQNKNILEIGANSGIMQWSIMKYANSLIEIEKSPLYYKQCDITTKSLFSLHSNNVKIYNNSLQGFISSNINNTFNALYASFVLYHLSKEEVEILKNKILPKCEIVIIPNRLKERKLDNGYHLNRVGNIEKLLKEANFKVESKILDYHSITIGKK